LQKTTSWLFNHPVVPYGLDMNSYLLQIINSHLNRKNITFPS
jgi:hypothetical protein